MQNVPLTRIFMVLGLLALYGTINSYMHFSFSGYDAADAVIWAVLAMGCIITSAILYAPVLSAKGETSIPSISKKEFFVLAVAIIVMVGLSTWEQKAKVDGEETMETIASILRYTFGLFSALAIVWIMRGGQLTMNNTGKKHFDASKKEQLKEMLDSGILTKEEYEKAIESL